MRLPTALPKLNRLLAQSGKQTLAIKHYPSRGQTTVQEIYQTRLGKLFLKKVSLKNHENCRIDPLKGSLAERELWAFNLASTIGLNVPDLRLLDKNTTVQIWLNHPDAHIYCSHINKLIFDTEDVFNCALFDWVTGQQDRHDANYLYDFVAQKIILIDSAHSFLKHDGSLPDYLRIFEISNPKDLNRPLDTAISQRLKKLNLSRIEKLIPLRNKDESEALANRLHRARNITKLTQILSLYRNTKI